jgi:hypothetical protein
MLNWLKNNLKKIKTKKEKKHVISFTKENGLWYFDFPNYPFSKHNLLMVKGSDTLLDAILINNNVSDKDHISLEIEFSDKPFIECVSEPKIVDDKYYNVIHLIKTEGSILSGYDYQVVSNLPIQKAYFCPVMFYTYGEYPNYILATLLDIY